MIASVVLLAAIGPATAPACFRRSLTWTNAQEEIHCTTIESITLSLVESPLGQVIRQSRRTLENVVDGVRVPISAGAEPEALTWALGAKEGRESVDRVAARIDRIVRAVIYVQNRSDASFSFGAVVGSVPAGTVSVLSRLSRGVYEVKYEDRETSEPIVFRGTVAVDPKTKLVCALRVRAQSVPLPHSAYDADLVVEQPAGI